MEQKGKLGKFIVIFHFSLFLLISKQKVESIGRMCMSQELKWMKNGWGSFVYDFHYSAKNEIDIQV